MPFRDTRSVTRSLRPGSGQVRKTQFRSRVGQNVYAICGIPKSCFEEALELARIKASTEQEAKDKAKVDAEHEWIATNAFEFWEEIDILYSLCFIFHKTRYGGHGEGFPEGFTYRFPHTDIKNGSQYVLAVTDWINNQLEDHELFPIDDETEFPSDYMERVSVIYKRMNRIYIIMYTTCIKCFTQIGSLWKLNNSYKHFYFFAKRYGLISRKAEFDPLDRSDLKPHVDIVAYDRFYEDDKAAKNKRHNV